MERVKLSAGEITERLSQISGWHIEGDFLVKKMAFNNFAESLSFINKIGSVAEAADHHPDIKFGWGYAEIATTTHDRDGITDVDFALAAKIDAI